PARPAGGPTRPELLRRQGRRTRPGGRAGVAGPAPGLLPGVHPERDQQDPRPPRGEECQGGEGQPAGAVRPSVSLALVPTLTPRGDEGRGSRRWQACDASPSSG